MPWKPNSCYHSSPLCRGHTVYDEFGVMDLAWHPAQPWLLTAGANSYIILRT